MVQQAVLLQSINSLFSSLGPWGEKSGSCVILSKNKGKLVFERDAGVTVPLQEAFKILKLGRQTWRLFSFFPPTQIPLLSRLP